MPISSISSFVFFIWFPFLCKPQCGFGLFIYFPSFSLQSEPSPFRVPVVCPISRTEPLTCSHTFPWPPLTKSAIQLTPRLDSLDKDSISCFVYWWDILRIADFISSWFFQSLRLDRPASTVIASFIDSLLSVYLISLYPFFTFKCPLKGLLV